MSSVKALSCTYILQYGELLLVFILVAGGETILCIKGKGFWVVEYVVVTYIFYISRRAVVE